MPIIGRWRHFPCQNLTKKARQKVRHSSHADILEAEAEAEAKPEAQVAHAPSFVHALSSQFASDSVLDTISGANVV
jgi:hypothetical protein